MSATIVPGFQWVNSAKRLMSWLSWGLIRRAATPDDQSKVNTVAAMAQQNFLRFMVAPCFSPSA
jgi:chromosomal replication initiation ATPase DnaA